MSFFYRPRFEEITDLDLFTPSLSLSSDFFDDCFPDFFPIQLPPPSLLCTATTTTITTRRIDPLIRHHNLLSLSDRVTALELALDRYMAKSLFEKRIMETIAKDCGERAMDQRDYKWTLKLKEGDNVSRRYCIEASSGSGKKEKAKKEKNNNKMREIEDVTRDHEPVLFRQRRAKALERSRGKRTELYPEDAAKMIQVAYKTHHVRRTQSVRTLRELAVAKARLRELRALFNNITYRHRLGRDAEERQRFSEKIIVVLLTVDSVEVVDVMVRAAKQKMKDELETMLDAVDPQAAGKARHERMTFDMPDGIVHKDVDVGVAQVVQMLGGENSSFEPRL